MVLNLIPWVYLYVAPKAALWSPSSVEIVESCINMGNGEVPVVFFK